MAPMDHADPALVARAMWEIFTPDQRRSPAPRLGGFAVAIGSLHVRLFDGRKADPGHELWDLLEALLDRNNPYAAAVLAQTASELLQPPAGITGMFVLVRRMAYRCQKTRPYI